MLDWLKNHPLWRTFSELDTLASLAQCLKIGAGVVTGLVAGFWAWLNGQPGSIKFVLFLSACLIAIWLINGVVWLRKRHASNKAALVVFGIAVLLAGILIFIEQGTDRAQQTVPKSLLSDHSDSKGSIPDKRLVTTSPATIREGLYVGEIRFTFGHLQNDRHSELIMRVFNGTGHVVELYSLKGQVKFKDANNTDPDRMGILPTPAVRHDTTKTVSPLQEWFLILEQRVPAVDSDKLQAMLKADIQIHFDLSELTIEVVGQNERNKVERLPIWDGVSYSRGDGFSRIVYGVFNRAEEPDNAS